mmetsp:Transcript_80430/g.232332  ORF Transcript_80430/g.232332 Transcript_80430/m.232332 type:complete len:245 (-) Transcript_80430:819-1553(-)
MHVPQPHEGIWMQSIGGRHVQLRPRVRPVRLGRPWCVSEESQWLMDMYEIKEVVRRGGQVQGSWLRGSAKARGRLDGHREAATRSPRFSPQVLAAGDFSEDQCLGFAGHRCSSHDCLNFRQLISSAICFGQPCIARPANASIEGQEHRHRDATRGRHLAGRRPDSSTRLAKKRAQGWRCEERGRRHDQRRQKRTHGGERCRFQPPGPQGEWKYGPRERPGCDSCRRGGRLRGSRRSRALQGFGC